MATRAAGFVPVGTLLTAPNGWVGLLVDHHEAGGLQHFEYRAWTSLQSYQNGDEPHALNNHHAQFRETHQRIVVGPNGGLMHQPDKSRAPVEVLLETPAARGQFEAAREVRYTQASHADLIEWTERGGRKVAPYVFPSFHGVAEALDPQWQRELHTVPFIDQIEQAFGEWAQRAEAYGWSGDRRGSTLNLTVAASADDSRHLDASNWSATSTFNWVGNNSAAAAEHQSRFTGVTIPNGATINSAVYTIQAISTLSGATCNATVGFVAADNAGQISSSATFLAATLGSTTTAWSSVASTTANTDFSAPDCAASLQELVDRAGWASGNAANLFVRNNSSTSGANRDAKSYNSSTSLCGRLAIDYTAATNVTATPTTLALVDTQYAPVIKHQITGASPTALTTTKYAPVLKHGIIPGVTALTTSLFVPTIVNPKSATPTTASLTTTKYAPVIGWGIIPTTTTLSTTGFGPTIVLPKLVTPGTLALSTALFAPTAVAPRLVTPSTLALVLSLFEPTATVGADITVTPSTLALVLSTYGPSALAPRLTTPGLATLVLSLLAPTVTTPRTATPTTASLTTAGYAPTVFAPRLATPGLAELVLAGLSPVVDTALQVFWIAAALTLSESQLKAATALSESVLKGATAMTTSELKAAAGLSVSELKTSTAVTVETLRVAVSLEATP